MKKRESVHDSLMREDFEIHKLSFSLWYDEEHKTNTKLRTHEIYGNL